MIQFLLQFLLIHHSFISVICMEYEFSDVAVVGAGYAGLTTARRFSQRNLTVSVLEATNSSGGRTKNYDLESRGPDRVSSKVVELGGQWIGNATVQKFAYDLIVNELDFDVIDASYTHGGGQSVLVSSNGRHNFTSLQDMITKFPKDVNEELTEALRVLDEMAATLDLKFPQNSPSARLWDSMTFTTWINQTVTNEETRTMLQAMCTTMIAQSADVVSFLHILFYIRAANGIANLQVYEQEYRVRGGTQAPAIRMAEELGKNVMHYNSPVTLIKQFPKNGTVSVYVTPQGELDTTLSVNAKFVVLTGPPPTLNRYIEFDPPLPPSKRQLFERLPLGNSVKAMLVYENGPFWQKQGYSGTIFASRTTKHGPLLSNCMDNTPAAGNPGVLLCFLEGDTSIEMMYEKTHQERIEYIASWLNETFGEEALNVDYMLDYNWAEQPFIGGAYSSYFPTGVWRQMGSALREPFGRLYWAGADYAEEGFGYINGAIESASRAVNQILKRLDDDEESDHEL